MSQYTPDESFEIINEFLVDIFNIILRQEEKAITTENLSVNELHVIEAIDKFERKGTNTMGNLAKHLSITMGSLTTSVSTLVKKGYVTRQKDEKDKRIVKVFLTEEAKKANEHHKRFHASMVKAVIKRLDNEELPAFTKSLVTLREYFKRTEKLK